MADVAKRAGVSPSTVARVLYSNGYATPEKRAIVEAAVMETGYRPNMMARGLRTSKSFTLGMVVSEAWLNAFQPYVAHAVQVEALRHGYTVITLNNNASAEVEMAGVDRFVDHHVDAVIFCSAIDPSSVHTVARAGIPTVQIERVVTDIGSMATVDPMPGMTEAINHLAGLGHQRIAFIGGMIATRELSEPASESVDASRVKAFRSAMEASALCVSSDFIRLGPYYDRDSEAQPGYLHMRTMLSLAERPTAVVAGSDLLAAGALQAIGEAGLQVPRDISIIGYDDTMA